MLLQQSVPNSIESINAYSRMRVQTEELRRFIPGVRMYQGKKTLFYNGEKLYVYENEEYFIYSEEERDSWEVVIVLQLK